MTDLDFSPTGFKTLEPDLGVGRLYGLTWEWV